MMTDGHTTTMETTMNATIINGTQNVTSMIDNLGGFFRRTIITIRRRGSATEITQRIDYQNHRHYAPFRSEKYVSTIAD